MELRRAGGVGFTEDIMGGSRLEPDSNVAGTDVGSLVVSARARFFGLLEVFGETERCPNWEEDGE